MTVSYDLLECMIQEENLSAIGNAGGRLPAILRRDGWRSARAEALHLDRLRSAEGSLALDDDSVAVLLHTVEGRTLLFDQNGLYNAWIVAAAGRTRGARPRFWPARCRGAAR